MIAFFRFDTIYSRIHILLRNLQWWWEWVRQRTHNTHANNQNRALIDFQLKPLNNSTRIIKNQHIHLSIQFNSAKSMIFIFNQFFAQNNQTGLHQSTFTFFLRSLSIYNSIPNPINSHFSIVLKKCLHDGKNSMCE